MASLLAGLTSFGKILDAFKKFQGPLAEDRGSQFDYAGSQFDPQGQGGSEGAEEEPFDFGKFLMRGLANSARAGQDFTQPVPIAGIQNVGVQRGNPLQTLLKSIVQRRRQGQQGQQGVLQSGFTGRL